MRKLAAILLGILALIAFFVAVKETVGTYPALSSGDSARALGNIAGVQIPWATMAFFRTSYPGVSSLYKTFKNARFWNAGHLPRFPLPEPPFKTEPVVEGLWQTSIALKHGQLFRS